MHCTARLRSDEAGRAGAARRGPGAQTHERALLLCASRLRAPFALAMPPRRSARCVATALPDLSLSLLEALPLPLLLHILALVPADTRLRVAEVSRCLRAAVATPSLWTVLNLTGLARPLCAALLHAAAGRAQGGLRELDVSCCPLPLVRAELSAVLRANTGLQRLTFLSDLQVLDGPLALLLDRQDVQRLLQDAPALRELVADVGASRLSKKRAASFLTPLRRLACPDCPAAEALLTGAAPFAPLRLRALQLCTFPPEALQQLRPALDDAATHPSLRELVFSNCGEVTTEAMEHIVAAAVARSLPALRFSDARLDADSFGVLTRALGDGALQELALNRFDGSWCHDAAVDAFADALRANTTLTRLTLRNTAHQHIGPGTVYGDLASTATLLRALCGHPTLRTLCAAAGGSPVAPAVAAVIAADAPSLTTLDVSGNSLGDEGLGTVLDALAHNTHLRELRLHDNEMSAALARDRLLPAVRAHAGLRVLSSDLPRCAAVRAAMELLARR